MKKIIYLIVSLQFIFSFNACEDYVQNVDPLIDQVQDERLDDPSQLNFVLKGVKHRFATVHDWITFLSGGLSDELYYDRLAPGASFPTLEEIDVAVDIRRDNNSVDGNFTPLGELRFFADDLARRANKVGSGPYLEEALFTGYLYGGIARFFYATYYGLHENQGGGIIDGGSFIPSAEMYDLAIDKLLEALNHTDFTYSSSEITSQDMAIHIVNSLIARCYLYKGDASSAATYAANGMIDGDSPFQSLHNELSQNIWYIHGGQRNQYVVNDRFADYVTADSTEANRIPLVRVSGTWWQQNLYPMQESPINVMSWQENELMLAELELTSNNTSALARVNAVRASHSLSPLAALDQNALIEERDKELWTTGARLPDQRRFDIWHLAPTTWKYLPITQSEINGNPNIDVN